MKKAFIYFQDQVGAGWKEAFEFWGIFMHDSQTTFYNKNGDVIGSIPHSMAFKIVEI